MQDPNFVRAAFARIADRYVLTNRVLSVGTDILWRHAVSRQVALWNPSSLLDVATGTGDLALQMQEYLPNCQVLGSDFCPEMLVHAAERGVQETMVADALNLPFEDDRFDVVTVAFGLRNMADYPAAIREMKRVIKPGGHFLVLDFAIPENLLRAPYRWYLHAVLPKLAGWLTGQGDAYTYLGESIESFPSGEDMLDLFKAEGLEETTFQPLSLGVAAIYTGKVPA